MCWLPLRSSICFACREHPPAFDALRSAFRYDGEVRRLVRAFKYGGQSSLAPALGREMVESYVEAGFDAGVIVPVALTGLRRRRRGYNQALLLAREVGRAFEIPVVEALSRRHFSGAQARSATAAERRRNVEGAFKVLKPGMVEGLSILLIDDIATTGATLDACARAVLDAGGREVLALTLARED